MITCIFLLDFLPMFVDDYYSAASIDTLLEWQNSHDLGSAEMVLIIMPTPLWGLAWVIIDHVVGQALVYITICCEILYGISS